MTVDQFRGANEVFLAGTLSDVMPIVKVDGKQVGDGQAGPRLAEAVQGCCGRGSTRHRRL